MRHFVTVGVLVIVGAVLAFFGLNIVWVMPAAASAQAQPVDWMWHVQITVMSFLFALIVVPMFYSLVVFRRRKGDTSDGEHIEGNTKLEITWTVIPLVVVVVFAFIGAGNLADTIRADPNAMVVKVTGAQWSWKFEYPDSGVVSNELHIPKGKQVLLRMTSTDVIHSFWVPEFRVKQDLVPGRFTELRITPTVIGNYWVSCAELCGSTHYNMRSKVIVTNQADYAAWIADQQAIAAAANTPEARGQILVTANGCAACHSINGAAGIAPTWLNLSGSKVDLAGGTTVTADDAYITESIKDPKAKTVAGFEAVQMPVYPFTDAQIADIVAYIKTLK